MANTLSEVILPFLNDTIPLLASIILTILCLIGSKLDLPGIQDCPLVSQDVANIQ